VGERVDIWTLRLKSIAVEASQADVPDNRPLSSRFTGRSFVPRNKRQLAQRPRERWLVDGDVGPGRGDDDVAVKDNGLYRFT
jgi:hypothetical protein